MRFVLRYWTRRSASTIALPVDDVPNGICNAATCLRQLAVENDWTIYGEAFLRFNARNHTVLHLPVRLGDCRPHPPMLAGHIDHGPVVAAYEVPAQRAWKVGRALSDYIRSQTDMTGPVEYHFDPSVGRTEGLIVVPVEEHPVDKAAYISIFDAVTG